MERRPDELSISIPDQNPPSQQYAILKAVEDGFAILTLYSTFISIGQNGIECYFVFYRDMRKGRNPRTPRKVSNLETVPELASRSPSFPEDQNLFTLMKPKIAQNKDIVGLWLF